MHNKGTSFEVTIRLADGAAGGLPLPGRQCIVIVAVGGVGRESAGKSTQGDASSLMLIPRFCFRFLLLVAKS